MGKLAMVCRLTAPSFLLAICSGDLIRSLASMLRALGRANGTLFLEHTARLRQFPEPSRIHIPHRSRSRHWFLRGSSAPYDKHFLHLRTVRRVLPRRRIIICLQTANIYPDGGRPRAILSASGGCWRVPLWKRRFLDNGLSREVW